MNPPFPSADDQCKTATSVVASLLRQSATLRDIFIGETTKSIEPEKSLQIEADDRSPIGGFPQFEGGTPGHSDGPFGKREKPIWWPLVLEISVADMASLNSHERLFQRHLFMDLFAKKPLISLVLRARLVCLAFGLWLMDHLEKLQDRSADSSSHFGGQVIAFCWIGGLQATVAYLVMSRLQAGDLAATTSRAALNLCGAKRSGSLTQERGAVSGWRNLPSPAIPKPDNTSSESLITRRGSAMRCDGCPRIETRSR